jgi:hypothetical protein
LDLQASGGKISMGPLDVLLPASGSGGPKSPLDLPFDRLDLESSVLTLRLPTRNVRVPVQGSLVSQGGGRYAVALDLTADVNPIRINGTIGPASGDVDLAVTGATLDASLLAAIASAVVPQSPLSAAGSISADARIRSSNGQGDATLNIRPDAVSLSIAPTDPHGTSTNVQGIGGVISVGASMVGGTLGSGSVTLQNATFNSASAGISAAAINGTIGFSDMANLVTQPSQKIVAGTLAIGKAQFANGATTFDAAGPNSVTIHRTQWSWLGGTVSAVDVRINPLQLKVDGTVQLAAVDLGQLLAYLAPDEASGEGKISGKLPITFDGRNLEFGRGLLQAAPGGRIQVKDLQAMSAALDQSVQAEIKRRVLQALADFDYDVLRADLKSDSTGLLADVRLAGRGHSGERTPLDTEIRIHGLDDLLKLYLGYERRQSGNHQPK